MSRILKSNIVNKSVTLTKDRYKFQEVCTICDIRPYILRYWETEFEEIVPEVAINGDKIYMPKNIEAIFVVKNLLFEKKQSIERAKLEIKNVIFDIFENSDDENSNLSDYTEFNSVEIKLNELIALSKKIQRDNNWI